jgi:hypothetical protein
MVEDCKQDAQITFAEGGEEWVHAVYFRKPIALLVI